MKTNQFTIKKNATLSPAEVEIITAAMQAEPGFTGVDLDEYRSYNPSHNITTIRADKELAGLAAHKDFGKNWAEFATLIILSKFRGQGLGKRLWQETLHQLSYKNIFVISANPIVKNRMALSDNFRQRTFWQLPRTVQGYFIRQKVRWRNVKELISSRTAPMGEFDFFVKTNHKE